MKTPFRGLAAAVVLATSSLVPVAAAQAQTDAPSDLEVSANVAIVSDYRFRGVSLSGGDFAIQGGVDLAHSSGFYVGTWMSSLEEDLGYGSTELDVYAGFSTDISDTLAFDIGVLLYAYPDAEGCNCDYWEPYASISTALGPVDASVGVAYAFDQNSLDFDGDGGTDDNLYIYTDLGTAIPGTPLSLSAHLGYTDGVLSVDTDGSNFDWSVGASATILGSLDVGVAYIGTEGPNVDNFSDDAIVATLSASF